ncbi:CRISPR-associated endonuclease Cas3'' [Streptomyces sp. NPDC051976]|uniref:CRISPR-associated endonuclease Cas3'' n=1 Tax=Streptomyces sp. NPDC051976 TaxID=3154947 RepID=UPI0034392818
MVEVRVWGKERGLVEPYPLIGHLVDTGVVAGALWDGFLAESQQVAIAGELGVAPQEARSLVAFWAGLHDVGKIQPGFQFQRDALKHPSCASLLADGKFAASGTGDNGVRLLGHQLAGARVVPSLLTALGYPEGGGRPASRLVVRVAQVLGGHHGRYPELSEARDVFDPLRSLPELGGGGWEAQRREHTATLRAVLGHPVVPAGAGLSVQASVVVAGLVVVADWLASQDDFVVRQQAAAAAGGLSAMGALGAHAARAAKQAPRLLAGAGLGRAQFAVRGFRERFPEIKEPHPLQASVDAELVGAGAFGNGPGVLLVTAPPGEGKTEVALAAAAAMGRAARCPGVAFLLPTRATADQIYARMAAFGEENLLDDAALTLLHGAADLNELYTPEQWREPEPRSLTDVHGSREGGVSLSVGGWLRSRGRGLLAPLSVGTVDQALMAVLPLRHNALRQLGLAGKTVVIDEAHAYDAFTHALLLRLLVWLGALRVPVVLLSATLTGRTATGLVRAYLTGAGHKPGSFELPAPSYPGWLYADGETAAVRLPRGPIGTRRASRLSVDLLPATHTYDPAVAAGRAAALLRELTPVWEAGGCAAVICTTVGEAQQTFNALRDHFRKQFGADYQGWDDRVAPAGETEDAPGHGTPSVPRLRLLHARFPGRRRSAITMEAEGWFGRVGKEGVRRPAPPQGTILVATQVIEQSMDLDFDLIVSDMAPMALLLQRAGRVWRHQSTRAYRPVWSRGPRVAVLVPVDGEGLLAVPRSWGDVYAPSLLRRTLERLEGRMGAPVDVPGDVQELVDGVYDEEFASKTPELLLSEDIERLTDTMAREGLATLVAIPKPSDVRSLEQLTSSDADEALIATRLGADTVLVLPVFNDSEQRRWLDEERSVPFPEAGDAPAGRFSRALVRELLGYTVPMADGAWRRACSPAHEPPVAWRNEPRLAAVVLLPHTTGPRGPVGPLLGKQRLTLHHELGLVKEVVI